MSTIRQLDLALCTGCTACQQSCPRACITMAADGEGFLRPVLNEESCVDCGICVSACPVLEPVALKHSPAAYAVKAKDEAVRSASSSGGIFTLLAEAVLDRGGVVFGAGFDEGCICSHMAVESREDLAKLRGSKYVQSRMGDAFSRVKTYLDSGRLVLFSGTPCQIEGLRKFLRKPYDNLITQDIICHGVPSPLAWRKYVERLEAKNHAGICGVTFRYKEPSWRMSSVRIQFKNAKTYVQTRAKDPFMRSFLKDLSLRPSCYHCAFKKVSRVSDFTLADFWGIQNCLPEMDDDKGTSLVICHTEKAQALFDSVKERTAFAPADLQEAMKYNTAMCQSVYRPAQRDTFMQEIANKPFERVVERYCKLPSLPERAVRKVLRMIKRLMKRG